MACSQCDGIEKEFNQAEARKMLRRFRRRGPDRTTRMLIAAVRGALAGTGLGDASLLDVGAGIGAIHHELLDGTVTKAVHVDASSSHIAAAREEVERRGHGGRVSFIQGDFIDLAPDIERAEVVTLDRVICCYPDMSKLVSLSSAKATRFYGAVYPRRAPWMAVALGGINLLMRLKRSDFRVFLHDPAAIGSTLRRHGFTRRRLQRTVAWEVALYERTPGH